MNKRYPIYKNSLIEWAPQIPTHWNVIPAMGIFHERNSKNLNFIEKNLLSLSYGKIIRKNIDSNLGLLPDSFETYHIVEANDIILRLTDLQNDKRSLRVGLVNERGIITSAYLCLTPKHAFPQYAYYLLHSYDVCKVFYSMGGGVRQSISFAEFKRLSCLLPPLDEQQKIADYLDRETQKIDALITAQKRLIELLGEKRRSLITHAVTRGLTIDVPMRDSGIQWLGEVPVHWKIERVKFLIFGIEGGFSPQCYSFPPNEGQWGVLKSGCVNGGIFNPYESKTLPEEIEPLLELEVCQGDVLMSRASGSVELIGSVALVEEQPKARLLLSDKTFRLSLNSDLVDARFFVAVMGSLIVRQQIKQVISGAEGLANNIAQSDIRELLIPLPPLLEQKEIIDTLNKKTRAIDHLSNTSIKMIALLQERRTSLISAAVTGQLQITD